MKIQKKISTVGPIRSGADLGLCRQAPNQKVRHIHSERKGEVGRKVRREEGKTFPTPIFGARMPELPGGPKIKNF